MRLKQHSPISLLLGALVIATVGALGISGCGVSKDAIQAGLSASCSVSQDQRGSFMARVTRFPLKVRVDSRFTLAQRQSIAQVVGTWNALGSQVIRQPLFEIESTLVSASQLPSDPRGCGAEFGTEDAFVILRETSSSHWSSIGLGKTIPAATFRCEGGGFIDQQMIYTFPELVDSSQFASIVMHELGHALGLDHSCLDKEGRSDYRSCTGLEESNPYRQAVMYPWLRISATRGSGEVKESLRDNDKIRAQCVIEPK